MSPERSPSPLAAVGALPLAAAVLAGGDSARMGRPKALLTMPDGETFIARILRVLEACGLQRTVVVSGRHHTDIQGALESTGLAGGVRLVRNPHPERGQLSSLHLAMSAVVDPTVDGMLVTLIDVPLISESVVTAVIDTWASSRPPVVRPAVGERHGHPVIFDRRVFQELRDAPGSVGAKAVVRAHARDVRDVQVADAGCTWDIDTPDDYDRLQRDGGDRGNFSR
ncbi:MAG: NTP transferase domain-containing protein [Vicinamibacterales bacterium]